MSEFRVEALELPTPKKHENADFLSIVEVQGSPVVIRSDSFQPGQLVAYIPVDAMVPVARPEFDFFLLNKDKPKDYERVKAKRLRGVFSMGMLVPVPAKPQSFLDSILGRPSAYKPGDDLTAVLGVKKFEEEEEPQQQKGTALQRFYRKWKWKLFGGTKPDARRGGRTAASGPFPYYDLESVRRYGFRFEEGEEVVITEKIHGQNARFGWVDGKYLVASHGQYKPEDGDSNWAVASKIFGIKEKLEQSPGMVVYGEVYGVNLSGAKIQHLHYDAKTLQFRVFDVYNLNKRVWLTHDEIQQFASAVGLQTVPELYRGPWRGLAAHASLAEGKSTLASHIREGFVVRPTSGREVERFGRLVLKLVGEGYLLDSKRTEKH